ncbi:amidohydrolase, partial [Rhizobium johnstonii]
AIKLVTSGTMSRHTDLKIILSHAGGFLPYAAHRIVIGLLSPQDSLVESGIKAANTLKQLTKFYFDMALSASPYALPSLLAFDDP